MQLSSQEYLTVHIAPAGTAEFDSVAGESIGHSIAGHMWFTLTNNDGDSFDYGFAPDDAHQGKPFAPGKVYHDDSKTYAGGIYEKKVPISDSQFNAMQSFANSELPSVFRLPTQRHYAANCCVC